MLFHLQCRATEGTLLALVNMGFSAGLVHDVSEALGYLFTVLYSGGRGRVSDMSV